MHGQAPHVQLNKSIVQVYGCIGGRNVRRPRTSSHTYSVYTTWVEISAVGPFYGKGKTARKGPSVVKLNGGL